MTYIGIDNGLSGGIVAVQAPGIITKAWTMPTRNKSKGNEVDAEFVASFFDQWMRDEITVILETPGKFAKGVQAISSMWDSYGAVRGVLESRGIRHIRITPQAWQKVMLVGCKKGDTKPAAYAKARQLWPTETWLPSPRCSNPHDGMIDAALIAEYGRISQL
jgi:hypothetical protein